MPTSVSSVITTKISAAELFHSRCISRRARLLPKLGLKAFGEVVQSLWTGSRGEHEACNSGGTFPAAWSPNALGGHNHCLIRTVADLLQSRSVVKLYAVLANLPLPCRAFAFDLSSKGRLAASILTLQSISSHLGFSLEAKVSVRDAFSVAGWKLIISVRDERQIR